MMLVKPCSPRSNWACSWREKMRDISQRKAIGPARKNKDVARQPVSRTRWPLFGDERHRTIVKANRSCRAGREHNRFIRKNGIHSCPLVPVVVDRNTPPPEVPAKRFPPETARQSWSARQSCVTTFQLYRCL